MLDSCPPEYIALANRLADAAGAVARRYFRTGVSVEDKADLSPVTIADREAESAMRTMIAESFPGHGVVGEEHGAANHDAEFVWVLDPIDGTKSFLSGRPIFGTLVGLVRKGKPLLGVIDQPILSERWVGAVGHPTTFNGADARTRRCGRLDAAVLATTGPDDLRGDASDGFAGLHDRVKRTLYGGDCYNYAMLSSGFIDLVAEAGLKAHDFCALAPVIEGAGGKATDWSGRPLTLQSDGTVLAVGDPALQAAALAALAEGISGAAF